jgi:hypothetical protein
LPPAPLPPDPLPTVPVTCAGLVAGPEPLEPDPSPAEQVPPLSPELTQLQTAPAEVITALSDAAGHAVMTHGTAA